MGAGCENGDCCREMSKKATEEKRAEEKRQREAARAAEKERKREEALEAKRYPMEDLQLLDELKQKAAAQGGLLASIDSTCCD